MQDLQTYYARWLDSLRDILKGRGAASDLAEFLCGGRAEAKAGHQVWVSQIKSGKRKPDGVIMAAIQAWMEKRRRNTTSHR